MPPTQGFLSSAKRQVKARTQKDEAGRLSLVLGHDAIHKKKHKQEAGMTVFVDPTLQMLET